jgi:hypothetical protein
MCDGNCAKCKVQCGGLCNKIFEKITADSTTHPQLEKEQKEMSEEVVKVSGCGAPKEAEEVRQNAAILHLQGKIDALGVSTPLSIGIKAIAEISLAVAVSGVILSIIAIFLCLLSAK